MTSESYLKKKQKKKKKKKKKQKKKITVSIFRLRQDSSVIG